ncbi:ParH-like protein [Streptomyces sp. NPDC059695]|uniref:ParH-like protein n=1 Tax=Streptomyces sp. NPDC059695 TaxID=3346910 RepID=UPI0036B24BA5
MLTDRSHRRLWRRVRALSEGLELPDPFDAESFLALLAARRGRPIEVLPVAVDAGVPCGLLVTTDQADYILCTPGTSALHRQHILLHEAAHLLCGHDRSPAPETSGVRALLPGLSPDLVRRVLGRTVYAEPAEQEAELLASLILHRALREGPGPGREHGRAGSLVGIPSRRPERSRV